MLGCLKAEKSRTVDARSTEASILICLMNGTTPKRLQLHAEEVVQVVDALNGRVGAGRARAGTGRFRGRASEDGTR